MDRRKEAHNRKKTQKKTVEVVDVRGEKPLLV